MNDQVNQQPRLVTAKELAAQIPLPSNYFLRLARRAEIPHYRIGRRILFVAEEVVGSFTHVVPPRR